MQRKSLAISLATPLVAGLCLIASGQVAPPAAAPSLYLVAASPTPRHNIGYETGIFRFDPQRKTLGLVRNLGTKKTGVDFVLADYESRKILVAWPRVKPSELDVIDMGTPGAAVRIPLNISELSGAAIFWEPWPVHVAAMRLRAGVKRPETEFSIVSKNLLARPGMGHWLALNVAANAGMLVAAVALDAGSRREALSAEKLAQIRIHGEFGLADLGDSDMVPVRVRANRVFLDRLGKQIDLGVAAPDVPGASVTDNWRLLAHTGATTVLHRSKDPASSNQGDGVSPLHVKHQQSDRWAMFRVPGSIPSVKMIDSWIMGVAASDALGRENPGTSNRRQGDDRPSADQRLKESGKYYPGVLFLIDSATGRFFQIRTGQADSEILLVNGNSVYYRVDNKLYVASLNGLALGPPQLLLQDDAIPDVHWAFFGS